MAALMRTEQLSLDVFDGGLLNLLLADAGFECFVNKWTVSQKKNWFLVILLPHARLSRRISSMKAAVYDDFDCV